MTDQYFNITMLASSETSIEILPYDCLWEIFKNLSIRDKLTVEKVCKKWRQVSLHGWPEEKQLDVRKSGVHTSDESPNNNDYNLTIEERCVVLQRCGRYLTEVSFAVDGNEVIFSKMIQRYCHQLEVVTIWLPFMIYKQKDMTEFFHNMDHIFHEKERLKSVVIQGKTSDRKFIYETVMKADYTIAGQLSLLLQIETEHITSLHYIQEQLEIVYSAVFAVRNDLAMGHRCLELVQRCLNSYQ